ncbi:MAG: hypothetical protein D6808_06135, partial [Candidatus Dadabacteria bacterium]
MQNGNDFVGGCQLASGKASPIKDPPKSEPSEDTVAGDTVAEAPLSNLETYQAIRTPEAIWGRVVEVLKKELD